MKRILFLLSILLISANLSAFAQDTVRVSLDEFIQRGIENSGQIDFERQKVNLAENRISQARAKKYLPTFELNSQHGVIPGVKSNRGDLDPNEYYLDPELENDWEDIGLFTRVEVSAVQPIFAWGGLNNLVNAAEAAATAAKEQFESQKAGIEIRLFELYQSYLLTLEVQRLLDEAQGQIDKITRQIEERQEEGDAEIDDSDVFKFKVFKSEFGIRAAEVQENADYIRSIWDYVLQADGNTVYMPEESFLDPVSNAIQGLDYYRMNAVEARPEMKATEAGIAASRFGLKATKAQSLPTLFLGLTGSYATTPNRPRQSNPFIINNSNYASGAVGFGFRQNLDFLSIKSDIDRRKLQLNQAKYLQEAAVDGIVLEVNQKYRDASLSKIKVEKTDEALVTSKQWLRQEQLDYDFGIGETKDLLDAMKKELELRVQLKQEIFEFNKNMAELFKASGFDIKSLQMSNQ